MPVEPEFEVDFTVQAVENLVTQFSSALDFYRELVQNSIDAGSAAIEVWLEFLATDQGGDAGGDGAGDEGTIAIHVDDAGEGMNEAIIDDQLTRLFSSSKDGDLTKIGKFGIGFVSIFAPDPRAVLLHTGRGGEAWEVLFHPDRSFTKTRLETPVEGTQITLYIAGDRARYRELVQGSRDTLRRWCVHSEAEISFEDRSFGAGPEPVNQPFEVVGECLTRSAAEGTEVVLAFHRQPEYGFYNKGLALSVSSDGPALLGEHASRLAHVAFKVKSRYLEHTLSRDTVVREGNFFKAIELVLAAADGPLQAALVAELEALGARPAWTIADLRRYAELLGYLASEPEAALARHDDRPLLRTVDGRAISLARLWDAASEDRRVFCSDAAGPLEDQLLAAGTPVLLRAGLGGESDALSSHGAPARLAARYASHRHRRSLRGRLAALGLPLAEPELHVTAPEAVFLRVVAVTPSPEEQRLVTAASELLAAIDAGYRRLVLCALDDGGPLFVLGRAIAPMMQRPPDGRLFLARRPRRPEAAVHRAHPLFQRWLALQRRAPELAAYCLAKDLLLVEDRLLGRDMALMAAARPSEAAASVRGGRSGGRR
ncbi:MAG: ATP-binding protein [Nannocystis sp.]|uniref:ATP-binding protein n=1 Tax=Nannocystis sp. TaxID=1962667 RepID=UPI0024254CBE|nr:ATP-binding protein [Nannocystis sp.]MBK9757426.1 ATP-binding protein [Nannocystis sp.]